MKFYQENKINPLASCLPLVLQLPVFISLFYMLRTDLKIDICGPKRSDPPASPSDHAHDAPRTIGCEQVDAAASAKFLLHPRHHRQGDRRRAGRADRPVRRLAARSRALLMTATADRTSAA